MINSYKLKDYYYNVRDFFFPRQKWLIKKIPRHWMDKDSLIRVMLFECVNDFVDKNGEDAFNRIDYTWCEESKNFKFRLDEILDYINNYRPELESRAEKELDFASSNYEKGIKKILTYEQIYGKYDKLMLELDTLDTFYLTEIIKVRNHLWT